MVPYGEVWRTGANEATEITVTKDVLIGGKKLAAGTYSLFTTPGADSWKFHFNSLLGLDGTGYYDAVAEKLHPGRPPEERCAGGRGEAGRPRGRQRGRPVDRSNSRRRRPAPT